MKKILRYWHTLRFLKAIQIYYQCKKLFFKRRRVSLKIEDLTLRKKEMMFIEPILETTSFFQGEGLCFLNQTEPYCLNLWKDPTPEKLWSYHLHYFDYLNAQCEESEKRALQLVQDWLDTNPPFEGTGWEPYPLSLRIVNWTKFQLRGGQLLTEALTSLYLQARFLYHNLEYHLLGNHLFANLKALLFAGCFFDTKESQHWLKQGLSLLEQELKAQILEDGGHFELSPMYHNIILEDLLDLMNLSNAYPALFPSSWESNIIPHMFEWAEKLCHPDGEIAFFNDSAFDIAPRYTELLRYAERLGLKPPPSSEKPLVYLRDSGFIRVHEPPFFMLIDVGEVGPSYLPGHAHADTLSFELSVKGQRVFVNPGCYSYQNLDMRRSLRSTAAHNTVEVNGIDSSEMWGAFRVAQRAHPQNIHITPEKEGVHITAQHNGYLRLSGKVVHQRDFYISPQSIRIEDQLIGCYQSATAYFHLAPSVCIEILNPHELLLHLAQNEKALRLLSEQAVEIITAPFSWRFGVLESHQVLLITLKEPKNKLTVGLVE